MYISARSLAILAVTAGLAACETPATTIVCWEEPVAAATGGGGVGYGGVYHDKFDPRPPVNTVCAPVPVRRPGAPHVAGGGGGAAKAPTPGTPVRPANAPRIATTLDSNAIAIDGKDYAFTEGDGPDRTTIASSGGTTADLDEMLDRITEDTSADLSSWGLE